MAVLEHGMVGDERWWGLLTWGFVASWKSVEGLTYDEGQLPVHPLASELWGSVVSLPIRAAGGASAKALG